MKIEFQNRRQRNHRPKSAILDVDGTLCDITDALPSLLTRPKDFDAFHRAAARCPPYQEALDYSYDLFRKGYTLLVVTSRKQAWHAETVSWLQRNFPFPYDGPFMRSDDDDRPSDLVKRSIYAYLDLSYDIRAAIDDDPKVCEMWRSLGLTVTEAPGNPAWAENSCGADAS